MIHPTDAELIEKISGYRQHHLPKGFEDEYMIQLRMYHRVASGGGPLPIPMLIALLRQFKLKVPSADEVASRKQIQWDKIPPGTRVIARVGGYSKNGVFLQRVTAGSLGIRIDGSDRTFELPAYDVELDRSIPADINQKSMIDDREGPDARASLLEKEIQFAPVKDWNKVKAGVPVQAGGKECIFVGVTPNNKNTLTVDDGGEMKKFPIDQVKLIETVEV